MVESIDLEAQGVAHGADGKVVFIEGALPGERVQVQVHRRKNNWEQATMTALAHASALRVRPTCPHFGLHAGAGLRAIRIRSCTACDCSSSSVSSSSVSFSPGLRPV